VGLRYNPPPGWPPPPRGFTPKPGWQPDPSWPPPPPGWQLWVNDDEPPAQAWAGQAAPARDWTEQAPPAQDWTEQAPPAQDWPRQAPPAQDWPGQTPPAQDWTGQARPAQDWSGQALPPGPGTAPGWAAEPTSGGRRNRGAGTSGWAIASFVLGILAVVPLSVIFGFVGLQKIRRLGQGGKGLAIAGLILSLIWVVVFVAAGVLSNGTATRQSSTGKITHRGDVGVFALATGDCFDNPTNTQDIESVTALPCTQPHDSQVFAKFNLTGADNAYPAADALDKMADTGCNSRTGSIDKAKATSDMTIRVLFPEQDAWADGQRTVSCLIVNPKPTLTTSLLTS
jgi:Domain of unknown function (DUF4190)/Septum formation